MDTTAPLPDDDGTTAAINDAIAAGPPDTASEDEQRRERQRVGLERAARLVDVDSLLGDQAWRGGR